MPFRTLRLPRWHSSNLQTETDTADDTSSRHLTDVPGRGLKYTSDQHENHAEPDSSTSTKAITDVETGQCTHQGSEFEGSNDNALNTRAVHFWEDGGK